jgi:DnaJ homolog subfamily C member 19
MTKLLLAALILGVVWFFLTRPAPLKIDEAEARAILGVDRDAGDDEIRAAHRRLVSALHPDKGGSTELTRRINAARDRLLGK